MKRILALFAALLLLPLAARADLVAHFRFDDDLKDVTGQHHGRPVDPKLAPAFAPGRVGTAVVIEKVNAGIELANPSAIDFSRDFTLATWVNVGNYYAEMPVLFKGRAERTAAPDKFFGVFGIEGMQVHGEGQGEWITNFRASNGLVPNDGGWHHIAVTYRTAEAPHFTPYVDGQGKTPADKGTFRGGDFTLKPDAPDSVLRLGCRADGDTWRYVRSHLRGLLDELQLYNEALKAEDIRFLFEHPGSTMKQRDANTFAPRFQLDTGHPWRPPFGVERVGLTPVIVQFASITHSAPEHWRAAYREGKEVERKALDVSGNSPFTARVTFTTSPAPEELMLLAKNKDGNTVELARWKVERPALEADVKAAADPVMNPVDLGAILPPADWLVLGPEQQPWEMHGHDLRPLLANPEAAWPHTTLLPFTADKFGADCDVVPPPPGNRHKTSIPWYLMIVRKSHKYIRTLEAGEPEELYDLAKDPEELTNLADRPEQAELLRQLRAAAIAELKRTGAKMVDSLPPVKP